MDEPTRYAPLTRSVPVADMALVDGNLEALLVPWDTPTMVYGDPGEPEPYREGFRRSAFDYQLRQPKAAAEVVLLSRHDGEEWGRGRSLTVADAGLHGVMQVYEKHRSSVEELVELGVDSVSIEFIPLQRRPRDTVGDDVRWRDRAILSGVALTSTPAYADSKLLAMRAQQLEQEMEAERAAQMADLDQWLNGIKASRPEFG